MSLVGELYSKIEEGREGKNIGLKTGLPKLDFYTGGFRKGVYKLIFSKSSVGKMINNNFAVHRSDFMDNDRAISEKAKLYVQRYYPEFTWEQANAEITKEGKKSLES